MIKVWLQVLNGSGLGKKVDRPETKQSWHKVFSVNDFTCMSASMITTLTFSTLGSICVKHLSLALGRVKSFGKVLGEIFSKVYEP